MGSFIGSGRSAVKVVESDGEFKDVLVNVRDATPGSLMFGAGLNSDAGIEGSISPPTEASGVSMEDVYRILQQKKRYYGDFEAISAAKVKGSASSLSKSCAKHSGGDASSDGGADSLTPTLPPIPPGTRPVCENPPDRDSIPTEGLRRAPSVTMGDLR